MDGVHPKDTGNGRKGRLEKLVMLWIIINTGNHTGSAAANSPGVPAKNRFDLKIKCPNTRYKHQSCATVKLTSADSS